MEKSTFFSLMELCELHAWMDMSVCGCMCFSVSPLKKTCKNIPACTHKQFYNPFDGVCISLRVLCPRMSACAHVCACVQFWSAGLRPVCMCPCVYVCMCSRRASGWIVCLSWSRIHWRGRCWWSTTSPVLSSTTTPLLHPSAKTARATHKRYHPDYTWIHMFMQYTPPDTKGNNPTLNSSFG